MLLPALILFLLGLCAGSFVNAVVWRVSQQAKSQKPQAKSSNNLSILSGRSQCVQCGHILSAKDLVPVLSWLSLRGCCRYCRQPISPQYPLVELTAGLVFALSYLLWPVSLDEPGQIILLSAWLLASIGLLALLIYDYRWMLLPNRIIYPTAAIAITGRLIYIIGFEESKLSALINWGLAVAIASGIFYLLFIVSRGKWIGFGDVRLGVITGTILAMPSLAFLMIFTASLLGTLAVLPSIISGKREAAAKVPFGPFLIAATWLVLLFGQSFIGWYLGLLP